MKKYPKKKSSTLVYVLNYQIIIDNIMFIYKTSGNYYLEWFKIVYYTFVIVILELLKALFKTKVTS